MLQTRYLRGLAAGLLVLASTISPSSAIAAEVIYKLNGVITVREATATNNRPLSFAESDPKVGDAFDLVVRFTVTNPSTVTQHGLGYTANYVSAAHTSLKIGSWSLDSGQSGLFESRVQVGNNVTTIAPPNDTLYYPADVFGFQLMSDYFNTGSSNCPSGLFQQDTNICYQTFISTAGRDTTGQKLNSYSLASLDIGQFQPETISFDSVDWNSNFRRLTIGNVNQSTQFVDSVPEPGSWALLIIGFSVAGSALRRRNAIHPRVVFVSTANS